MNLRVSLKAIGLSALVAMMASQMAPALGGTVANVVYKGELSAKPFCKAVVQDNVAGLRNAIRMHRTYPLENVPGNFACNGLPLYEFAATQNATRVGEFLEKVLKVPRGRVTVERVSSINR